MHKANVDFKWLLTFSVTLNVTINESSHNAPKTKVWLDFQLFKWNQCYVKVSHSGGKIRKIDQNLREKWGKWNSCPPGTVRLAMALVSQMPCMLTIIKELSAIQSHVPWGQNLTVHHKPNVKSVLVSLTKYLLSKWRKARGFPFSLVATFYYKYLLLSFVLKGLSVIVHSKLCFFSKFPDFLAYSERTPV